MTVWETYPITYRQKEIQTILSAVQSGECVSVIGLSGAGKSNLMGFMTHREDAFPHPRALVDCNRLGESSTDAFFRLIRYSLGDTAPSAGEPIDEWIALEALIHRRLGENSGSYCLLLDRFEFLTENSNQVITSNLRALRDAYKYQLTFVTATRRPHAPHTEFAELFYAHTLWLGPLSELDTHWNVTRYAQRVRQNWGDDVVQKMLELTRGYPSLLRAVSEAYAGGAPLDLVELKRNPTVRRRISEFWDDNPADHDLQKAGLAGLPLLERMTRPDDIDSTQLTAKEALLLEFLRSHPGAVCTKDDLIRAVWPEDRIYEQGIRDDSLAQLARRLRVKIEPDPSVPIFIHTVPGRGYRFTPKDEG